MQGTHDFLNIYDEFVHSFKIIVHKRLIITYLVFLIFHSITFLADPGERAVIECSDRSLTSHYYS